MIHALLIQINPEICTKKNELINISWKNGGGFEKDFGQLTWQHFNTPQTKIYSIYYQFFSLIGLGTVLIVYIKHFLHFIKTVRLLNSFNSLNVIQSVIQSSVSCVSLFEISCYGLLI